jgi:hypothetical protein
LAVEAVTYEPEHRRPQADEQRAALGVATFVLSDRLRADPKHDAESNGPERARMEMLATES